METKILIILISLVIFGVGGFYSYQKIFVCPKEEGISQEISKGVQYVERKIKGLVQEELALCGKIEGDWKRKFCQTIVEKDLTECENSSCYSHIAVQLEDPAICKKIEGEGMTTNYMRLLCEAVIKRDISKCQEIRNEIKGAPGGHNCKLWLALLENDPLICDRPECRALVTKDPKFCSRVELDPEDCYFKLAAITNDDSICKNLRGNELVGDKAACIKVANREIEEADCKRRASFQNLNLMRRTIAILDGDSSLCEKETDPNECYKVLAFVKAGIFPKTYALNMQLFMGVPSIRETNKSCVEVGGEILPEMESGELGKGCSSGIIIETADGHCCVNHVFNKN